LTIEELTALKDKYQKLFRLMDWDIQIWYARKHEFNDGVAGNVSLSLEHRRAWIKVLHLEDRDETSSPIEYIVVHEMAHIVLGPLTWNYPNDSPGHILEEQAIGVFTSAITGLEPPRKDYS
jgi:hypothetical protein